MNHERLHAEQGADRDFRNLFYPPSISSRCVQFLPATPPYPLRQIVASSRTPADRLALWKQTPSPRRPQTELAAPQPGMRASGYLPKPSPPQPLKESTMDWSCQSGPTRRADGLRPRVRAPRSSSSLYTISPVQQVYISISDSVVVVRTLPITRRVEDIAGAQLEEPALYTPARLVLR